MKSARGGGGVGGRIEGMGKVASGGGAGWFSRLFGGGQSVVSGAGEGEEEDDDGLIWGGKGPFRWQDVEGVEVDWGVSALGMVSVGKEVAVTNEVEKGDGLDELEEFLLNI